MSNPLFEAALLQRGLRAMDVMLTEIYQVDSHICLPQGGVYPKEFPEEGVDFRPIGGVESLKGIWRSWMYEEGGKGAFKEATVHPMVEQTVVDAFKVAGTCDKDKNSHITKDEWETCQKSRKAEDVYYDFEYLYALFRVSGQMLKLEKQGFLNRTDPETYPELIQAKADAKKAIEEKDGQISTLENDLGISRSSASFYQNTTIGLGGALALVALVIGVRHFWRDRNKPTAGGAPTPAPGGGGPAPKADPAAAAAVPAPAAAPAAGAKPASTPPPGTVEFVIGKEPGERGGVSGFTLSNLPEDVAKLVSRNHVLVRIEGDRYLVQEIGQNAGIATIERAGARIAIPRATDANPWAELTRGDAINLAGAVRLPFGGAPAAGASPASPFTLEVIAPGGAPAANPAAAAAPKPAPAPASPAAKKGPVSALDAALDNLDANEVAVTDVPNITTITKEAIEHQVRFLFPELENVRYNAIVQDLADEALHRLQGLGGEDFKTEFQHELNTYREAIRGAAPTRFLIKTIEERLAIHRRAVDTAKAAELIRVAEDDRAHAGRREELKDIFRRATAEAAKKAAP